MLVEVRPAEAKIVRSCRRCMEEIAPFGCLQRQSRDDAREGCGGPAGARPCAWCARYDEDVYHQRPPPWDVYVGGSPLYFARRFICPRSLERSRGGRGRRRRAQIDAHLQLTIAAAVVAVQDALPTWQATAWRQRPRGARIEASKWAPAQEPWFQVFRALEPAGFGQRAAVALMAGVAQDKHTVSPHKRIFEVSVTEHYAFHGGCADVGYARDLACDVLACDVHDGATWPSAEDLTRSMHATLRRRYRRWCAAHPQ